MAKTVALPGGEHIPALGIGTWNMAVQRRSRRDEIVALQTAVDLGMTVVDTAEMYGNGAAEELVAEAVGHRRREIFLVSKVLPQNASRRGTIAACEASLRRLHTDHLDLYLLHWRGRVPLDETIDAFIALRRGGKIRYWGVSNFDVDDMADLDVADGVGMRNGTEIPAANQVLYNLTRRGIEFDLLPSCQARGIVVMAYSPLEQGALSTSDAVIEIARTSHATPAQVALAWVLRQPGVMTVPKSGSAARVRENAGALEITLTPAQLREIDRSFPPPVRKKPMEMI